MFSVASIQHTILFSSWAKGQVAIKQHTMCSRLWITGAFRCFHHAVIIRKTPFLVKPIKNPTICRVLTKKILFFILERNYLERSIVYVSVFRVSAFQSSNFLIFLHGYPAWAFGIDLTQHLSVHLR